MNAPRSGPGPDGGIALPQYVYKEFILAGTAAATAANFGVIFFNPGDGDHQLISVRERHATAGTDAGAVTLMLKKVPSGTAAASGTNMLASGLSLKTTADTLQAATLSSTAADLVLTNAQGAAAVLTGTPTSLAGLVLLTIWKKL